MFEIPRSMEIYVIKGIKDVIVDSELHVANRCPEKNNNCKMKYKLITAYGREN